MLYYAEGIIVKEFAILRVDYKVLLYTFLYKPRQLRSSGKLMAKRYGQSSAT